MLERLERGEELGQTLLPASCMVDVAFIQGSILVPLHTLSVSRLLSFSLSLSVSRSLSLFLSLSLSLSPCLPRCPPPPPPQYTLCLHFSSCTTRELSFAWEILLFFGPEHVDTFLHSFWTRNKAIGQVDWSTGYPGLAG